MKRAFTLMEVNLAMLIMAGGILSIVGLYSFGFRENRQSREDIASASYADAVMSPLIWAISATNLKWSVFRNVKSFPNENGWQWYFDSHGQVVRSNGESVFVQAMGAYANCAAGGDTANYAFPSAAKSSSGLDACGIVVMHEENSPVVRIGFRAAYKQDQLMASPLYYTEVRFQGVIDQ